jgi:hypothetical protein
MKEYILLVFFLFTITSGIYGQENVLFPAENDQEFISGSKIQIVKYDAQTIDNLTVLCKVWGFIKYYHPSVAEGKYNWDFELFRIMPIVLNTTSRQERNTMLFNWIENLGKVTKSKQPELFNADNVKMYPDISWIEDSSLLGIAVSDKMKIIKDADRSDKNYYIDLAKNIGTPIFKNENAYSDLHYPDTGYRLLALFRYWNIIQYYYPYKYLIGEKWHDILHEFIPQFIDATDRIAYKKTLLKLIASINDTHAKLNDALMTKDIKGENIVPVRIDFIENKAVVTDLYTMQFANNCLLKKGDVILSIDNLSVDSIIIRETPYVSASNYPTLLRNLASDLLKTDKDKLYIEIERAGKLLRDTVLSYPMNQVDISDKLRQDRPLLEHLSPYDITYLYLGSKSGGTIPNDIHSKGIIIDLRCYPSQKVEGYWDFFQLYPHPIEFTKFTYGSITTPGLFGFSKIISAGKVNPEFYQGKKVILINELTQSQAEFLTMKYRFVPNTVVIGSTTAGSDGNVSKFHLPGAMETSITGLGTYYHDGQETQRIGIVPEIEIKPTIKGIREGKDEVLEKAIEIIISELGIRN